MHSWGRIDAAFTQVNPSHSLSVQKEAISERLRELAKDDRKRSKAARLRDVVEEVEATLAAGISRTHVLQVLRECGLDMSPATFDSTLTRIRAKLGKPPAAAKSKVDILVSNVVAPVAPIVAAPSHSIVPSHDPADLNKILSTVPDLVALAKLAKKSPNR